MAEQLFGITADQGKRIGKALRTVEQRPARQSERIEHRRPVERDFWALIGDEDPAHRGRYKWQRVAAVGGTINLVSLPAGVATTAGDDFTAHEANLRRGLNNHYVRLRFDGFDNTTSKPVFRFVDVSTKGVSVMVIGRQTQGGHYTGSMAVASVAAWGISTYSAGVGGWTPGVNEPPDTPYSDCVIVNLAENPGAGIFGSAGAHWAQNGAVGTGRIVGFTTGTMPLPIVEVANLQDIVGGSYPGMPSPPTQIAAATQWKVAPNAGSESGVDTGPVTLVVVTRTELTTGNVLKEYRRRLSFSSSGRLSTIEPETTHTITTLDTSPDNDYDAP